MPINTLDEVQVLLDADATTFIGGGQSAQLISAEAALHVSLPPTYRAFLSRWGHVSVVDLEYLGLGCRADYSNLAFPNVVWYTLQMRESGTIPTNLLPIRGPVADSIACLDLTRSLPGGEYAVTIWGPTSKTATVELELDFAEFMLDELNEWLD